MSISNGTFKGFQYSRTENPVKKTGLDRNILSQPRPKMQEGSKKRLIGDDWKEKLIENKY